MQAKYDEDLMKLAEKRVKKKKEFHSHALVYVLVNAFLSVASGEVQFIVLFGWGIGLVIHGFTAYSTRFSGKPTQAEIQREYAKLSGQGHVIDYTDTADAPRHN